MAVAADALAAVAGLPHLGLADVANGRQDRTLSARAFSATTSSRRAKPCRAARRRKGASSEARLSA
jgi:hypothetical protein